MRCPYEYRLIVHGDAKIDKVTRAPIGMLRLFPKSDVPMDYYVVNTIAGESIYDYEGMLRPAFKALRIHR